MSGPSRPEPIDRLLAPLREFTEDAASSGVLLIIGALVAVLWANSPIAALYEELFHTPVTIGIGPYALAESLHFWINDGLMSIFFLLVGLEIKREMLVGELASARRAILPLAAAGGGALLPALIFLIIAGGTGDGARGWGIPMATDIAFALGLLALLRSRVPVAVKVFLTALAIADDLIAVIVIALFYSGELLTAGLGAAALVLTALLIANRLGVRRPVVYAALGLALWLAILQSGIHATIAGVLLAITIPSRTRLDATAFQLRSQRLVDSFSGRAKDGSTVEHQHAALWELEEAAEQAQAPMLRIEHALQPWVSFMIVPFFALANAGVVFRGDLGEMLAEPVVLGVVGGLVLGKQVGITAAAWVVVRSGLAVLPDGVSWLHIYGAAWLGGIGFTMSLFVAELAYGQSPALSLAKVAILGASVVAGLGGLVVLSLAGRSAQTGDSGLIVKRLGRDS